MLILNGVLMSESAATLPATDRALTHGLGLYETIKLEGGVPVFFEEHVTRLVQGIDRHAGLHEDRHDRRAVRDRRPVQQVDARAIDARDVGASVDQRADDVGVAEGDGFGERLA